MALARIKTWNPGDILTAADLNAEFNNELNNPIALISPTTGVINFNNQAHTNFKMESLTVDPASATVGRLFFQTGRNQLEVDDGTIIRGVPTLSATGLSAGQIPVVSSSAQNQFLTIGMGTSGQVLTVTSSTSIPTWGAAAGAQFGSRVMGLIGTITSSQTATFAFDQAIVRTTGNTQSFQVNATSSFGLNLGTTGAGGRDTTPVFSSTFAHVYVITTGANSTAPAAIASTSPPPGGPVMPTSYSAVGYLGTFTYSSASTTFSAPQRVRGAWIYNDTRQNIVADGRSTTEATVNVASLVPSQALSYHAYFNALNNGSSAFVKIRVVSGSDYDTYSNTGASGGNTNVILRWPEIIPNVSQQFFYIWSIDPTATFGLQSDILGYRVANGGE